jgi:hypothetical protein
MHSEDGGDGGVVKISGGMSKGANQDDAGGNVEIRGGSALAGYGGSVSIASGVGASSSSGSAVIKTSNAGSSGSSGSIAVSTGELIESAAFCVLKAQRVSRVALL